MTDTDLLGALVEIARPRILADFRASSCIASTAIAIDVLAYFGVEAEAVECEGFAANRLAISAIAARLVPDWHAGAWTVGVVRNQPKDLRTGQWPGAHLVAVTDDALIDLSADQFSRPRKGIEVPALVCALDRDQFFGDDPVVSVPLADGAMLSYKRLDNPQRSWRDVPDWSDRSRRKRIVGDVIRAIRSRATEVGLPAES